MKKLNKVLVILMCFLALNIFFVSVYAAKSDPTLVTKLNTALKKIQGYLVKLAAPAARCSDCIWRIN